MMLSIRPAAQADLVHLARLWHERLILWQQVDRRVQVLPDARARWLGAASVSLLDDQCRMLVAADEQAVVSYIVGRIQPSPPGISPATMGLVTELVVDAHEQPGGAGRLLLDNLRVWFKERDVTQVAAYTSPYLAVEQAFWQAQGATKWMDIIWLK